METCQAILAGSDNERWERIREAHRVLCGGSAQPSARPNRTPSAVASSGRAIRSSDAVGDASPWIKPTSASGPAAAVGPAPSDDVAPDMPFDAGAQVAPPPKIALEPNLQLGSTAPMKPKSKITKALPFDKKGKK